MTTTLILSAAPTGGSFPTGLIVLLAMLALLFAASALMRSISAISELIADLMRSLFSSIGALMLIGLALVCVVLLAMAGIGAGAPPASG